MKGIILAGGCGSRLLPLTKVTNKHLLPVYNKPMIYYPIETLVKAGIKEILIVTGGNSAGDFLKLLGSGKNFGLRNLYYAYQENEGGIADALKLAESFCHNDLLTVILGDNIVEDNISESVKMFEKQEKGARIFLKEVSNPQRFGVPVFGKNKVSDKQKGRIIKIEEKPKFPKSKYAVTGIYMYDSNVFDIIRTLSPSNRGELEITDVNNKYIEAGQLQYEILTGSWTDAGTFESLLRANIFFQKSTCNS